MPGAPSSVLVTSSKVASLLLVVGPGAPSSFSFLVVGPGAQQRSRY